MRRAVAFALLFLSASSVLGAGFTAEEIRNLPKVDPVAPINPGPDFFTRPERTLAHRATVHQIAVRKLVCQRAAVRARLRRQHMASRVDEPDWGMIQVKAAAWRVYHGGLP